MRAAVKYIAMNPNYALFLGAGAVITLLLALQWFELALGLLATIPFILLLRLSFQDGSLETRFLSVSYMAGQSLCWLIGFLGCVYIFPLIDYSFVYLFSPVNGQPIEHSIVTMVLVNLTMWGSFIGSQLVFAFQRTNKKGPVFSALPGTLVHNSIRVTAIIFIVFLFASYYGGALSARTLVGSRIPVDSILYWITGPKVLSFLIFFFMGAYLRSPLFNLRNGGLLLILMVCMFLSGLTGGRGEMIRMVLFFLGGSLYSSISIKKAAFLTMGLVPLVLALVLVVGAARGGSFTTDPFEQRIVKMWQAMTLTIVDQWKDRTQNLLRRIANDFAGQLVIDTVVERQEFIGFRNFERLTTMFIPKFIIGEKPSADDGPERLRDDYGLQVTDFHSIPITFMADAFERGGYWATFLGSFLLSFWLTLVGRILYQLKWPLLRAVLLIVFAYHCFNIQTYSVIGTIREVTYSFVRDAILVGSVVFIIYLLSTKFFLSQKA